MIVLDASVWIKILLPDRDEPGTIEAVALWQSLDAGDEAIAQPPHWLAEVLAVLSRLTPGAARQRYFSRMRGFGHISLLGAG